MLKVPSMSSKKLVKLLETGGAFFVRQGSTDHAIYARLVNPGKPVGWICRCGERLTDELECLACDRGYRKTESGPEEGAALYNLPQEIVEMAEKMQLFCALSLIGCTSFLKQRDDPDNVAS